MVRYLLQLNADVNVETSVSLTNDQNFSLIFILNDCFLFLKLLFTPLHSAAQQGHVMIVKLLLEHGASPNKTNKVNTHFLVVFSWLTSEPESLFFSTA